VLFRTGAFPTDCNCFPFLGRGRVTETAITSKKIKRK
jgi:hypothetical protein